VFCRIFLPLGMYDIVAVGPDVCWGGRVTIERTVLAHEHMGYHRRTSGNMPLHCREMNVVFGPVRMDEAPVLGRSGDYAFTNAVFRAASLTRHVDADVADACSDLVDAHKHRQGGRSAGVVIGLRLVRHGEGMVPRFLPSTDPSLHPT